MRTLLAVTLVGLFLFGANLVSAQIQQNPVLNNVPIEVHNKEAATLFKKLDQITESEKDVIIFITLTYTDRGETFLHYQGVVVSGNQPVIKELDYGVLEFINRRLFLMGLIHDNSLETFTLKRTPQKTWEIKAKIQPGTKKDLSGFGSTLTEPI